MDVSRPLQEQAADVAKLQLRRVEFAGLRQIERARERERESPCKLMTACRSLRPRPMFRLCGAWGPSQPATSKADTAAAVDTFKFEFFFVTAVSLKRRSPA